MRSAPPQGPEHLGLGEAFPATPLFGQEYGPISEVQALIDGRTAPVRLRPERLEDFEEFDSEIAMRFGARRYTDKQFELIHQATAERDLPAAAPIELDD